ncbi:MAG: PhnD/SsuA/transferrin family substrate-binding protein [Pseudomonadota bacterium]
MIAALQMYDWPEVQGRLDAFWAILANELRKIDIDAPEELWRDADLATVWRSKDLLLGQTCGLPYVSGRCGASRLLARPDFDLPGARGGTYSSALICRADDDAEELRGFAGRRAAINEYGSQSGCNALADAILDLPRASTSPFFATVDISGAHRASADLVAAGDCDVAAIDAVAWALYGKAEPRRHERLRVLQWTRPMPALPFITAADDAGERARLFQALADAVKTSNEAPAGPPIPAGVTETGDADYDPIRQMADRVAGMRLSPGSQPL